MTLDCFKCGKQLKPVFSDNPVTNNQPSHGTTFHSYGQYGSTVIDSMDHRMFLEINICDPCLLDHAERVLHGCRREAAVMFEYKPWDPEEDLSI